MKIVASHQPHFNPYLGYMAKMKVADTFILSDDVQFIKSGFIHRNKVRSWQNATGWRWLTIPVTYRSNSKINEVNLADGVDVMGKLLNILRYEYQSAPNFAQIYNLMVTLTRETEYVKSFGFLVYLSLAFFGYAMGIMPSTRLASSFKYDVKPGDKNGRLIALTRRVDGDAYLAGYEAARTYLDPQRFTDAGIKLLAMEYLNPEYPQIHDKDRFIPQMGVIDALMNTGNDARRLISPEHYRIIELN